MNRKFKLRITMEKIDLNKMKLPLTKKKFGQLRSAIRTGQVKWMDMSKELMFSYQDYWKLELHKNIENLE